MHFLIPDLSTSLDKILKLVLPETDIYTNSCILT
jgi:hypothetical protein